MFQANFSSEEQQHTGQSMMLRVRKISQILNALQAVFETRRLLQVMYDLLWSDVKRHGMTKLQRHNAQLHL